MLTRKEPVPDPFIGAPLPASPRRASLQAESMRNFLRSHNYYSSSQEFFAAGQAGPTGDISSKGDFEQHFSVIDDDSRQQSPIICGKCQPDLCPTKHGDVMKYCVGLPSWKDFTAHYIKRHQPSELRDFLKLKLSSMAVLKQVDGAIVHKYYVYKNGAKGLYTTAKDVDDGMFFNGVDGPADDSVYGCERCMVITACGHAMRVDSFQATKNIIKAQVITKGLADGLGELAFQAVAKQCYKQAEQDDEKCMERLVHLLASTLEPYWAGERQLAELHHDLIPKAVEELGDPALVEGCRMHLALWHLAFKLQDRSAMVVPDIAVGMDMAASKKKLRCQDSTWHNPLMKTGMGAYNMPDEQRLLHSHYTATYSVSRVMAQIQLLQMGIGDKIQILRTGRVSGGKAYYWPGQVRRDVTRNIPTKQSKLQQDMSKPGTAGQKDDAVMQVQLASVSIEQAETSPHARRPDSQLPPKKRRLCI